MTEDCQTSIVSTDGILIEYSNSSPIDSALCRRRTYNSMDWATLGAEIGNLWTFDASGKQFYGYATPLKL
jgi:hypothetical protein